MKLYHVTTEKKARQYKNTGYIKAPVRGYNTLMGALAWACKVGRKVIYECEANKAYKMPDHHNQWGEAWWNDENIRCSDIKCVFSADRNA